METMLYSIKWCKNKASHFEFQRKWQMGCTFRKTLKEKFKSRNFIDSRWKKNKTNYLYLLYVGTRIHGFNLICSLCIWHSIFKSLHISNLCKRFWNCTLLFSFYFLPVFKCFWMHENLSISDMPTTNEKFWIKIG